MRNLGTCNHHHVWGYSEENSSKTCYVGMIVRKIAAPWQQSRIQIFGRPGEQRRNALLSANNKISRPSSVPNLSPIHYKYVDSNITIYSNHRGNKVPSFDTIHFCTNLGRCITLRLIIWASQKTFHNIFIGKIESHWERKKDTVARPSQPWEPTSQHSLSLLPCQLWHRLPFVD